MGVANFHYCQREHTNQESFMKDSTQKLLRARDILWIIALECVARGGGLCASIQARQKRSETYTYLSLLPPKTVSGRVRLSSAVKPCPRMYVTDISCHVCASQISWKVGQSIKLPSTHGHCVSPPFQGYSWALSNCWCCLSPVTWGLPLQTNSLSNGNLASIISKSLEIVATHAGEFLKKGNLVAP